MREFDLGAVTAYAIAVKNGFKGTEREWLESLKGKTGDPGKQGEPGKPGAVQTVNGKTPDENGNVEIEAGGVSSWNDLTDKPFYEESSIVELLPETTFTEDNFEAETMAIPRLGLVDGNTYTVTMNGTDHSCIAMTLSADGTDVVSISIALDNGALNIMELPPELSAQIGTNVIMEVLSSEFPFTLSIKGEVTTIHKLDGKFLPDGVPYVVEGGKVEVLAECQPEFVEDEGMFTHLDAIDIVVGKTYTVRWNGVEYTCVAQAVEDDGVTMAVMGDVGALDGEPTTGEPFIILAYPPEFAASMGVGVLILPIDGSTELTLAIYSDGTEIRKLDNRCLDLGWLPILEEEELLPETVVSVSETTPSYGPNGVLYNTSLDDTVIPVETGQKVAVYFDGVRYEGEVAYEYGANQVYLNSTKTLGITFRTNYTVIQTPTTGEHTVRVCGLIPDKMPAEFLPDDATVFHLTSPNGTKFAITVSDDGTLSATEVSE